MPKRMLLLKKMWTSWRSPPQICTMGSNYRSFRAGVTAAKDLRNLRKCRMVRAAADHLSQPGHSCRRSSNYPPFSLLVEALFGWPGGIYCFTRTEAPI